MYFKYVYSNIGCNDSVQKTRKSFVHMTGFLPEIAIEDAKIMMWLKFSIFHPTSTSRPILSLVRPNRELVLLSPYYLPRNGLFIDNNVDSKGVSACLDVTFANLVR